MDKGRWRYRAAAGALAALVIRVPAGELEPVPLSTWGDLDAVVADNYASFTNYAWLYPPGAFAYAISAGYFTFPPGSEIGAATNLFGADNRLGVPVWTVRVTETQAEERVWLYAGAAEAPFRTNAVPAGFDPSQWVEGAYGAAPSWLQGDALGEWYAGRDRSRMRLGLTLVASGDWETLQEAFRVASTNGPAPQAPPPTLPPDTNRLAFAGIGRAGEQVLRLWLYSPEGGIPIDIFESGVLPPVSNRWSLTGYSESGDPFSVWDVPLGNGSAFFRLARGDTDSDGDGIPDGRETLLFDTKPLEPDSDFDGLSDWEETYRCGTDPNAEDSDGDGVLDGEDQMPLTRGPLIELASPGDGAALASSAVAVSGTVAWEGELAGVLVDGESVALAGLGGGNYAFSTNRVLDDGEHVVTIRALAAGSPPLESKKSAAVTVDALPPEVAILSPSALDLFDGANVRVSVWTESTNDTVTVNGTATTRDGYIRYAWVALALVGTNTIQAVAVDSLNRSGTDTVDVVCTDIAYTDPDDADSDGVPDPSDPAPNDPGVSGTVVITYPPNGMPVRCR